MDTERDPVEPAEPTEGQIGGGGTRPEPAPADPPDAAPLGGNNTTRSDR